MAFSWGRPGVQNAPKALEHTLYRRHRFSSRALVITLTELSAMAAPATIGFRYPSAASGMPATL